MVLTLESLLRWVFGFSLLGFPLSASAVGKSHASTTLQILAVYHGHCNRIRICPIVLLSYRASEAFRLRHNAIRVLSNRHNLPFPEHDKYKESSYVKAAINLSNDQLHNVILHCEFSDTLSCQQFRARSFWCAEILRPVILVSQVVSYQVCSILMSEHHER